MAFSVGAAMAKTTIQLIPVKVKTSSLE